MNYSLLRQLLAGFSILSISMVCGYAFGQEDSLPPLPVQSESANSPRIITSTSQPPIASGSTTVVPSRPPIASPYPPTANTTPSTAMVSPVDPLAPASTPVVSATSSLSPVPTNPSAIATINTPPPLVMPEPSPAPSSIVPAETGIVTQTGVQTVPVTVRPAVPSVYYVPPTKEINETRGKGDFTRVLNHVPTTSYTDEVYGVK